MEQAIYKGFARYYDIVFENKNYKEESQLILDRCCKCGLLRDNTHIGSVLELGCGTARHAIELLSSGNIDRIDGIELSREMIDAALRNVKNSLIPQDTINIISADIKTFKSDKKYDLVVSLFGVLSYMIENTDIDSAIATASQHLNREGIFIFDIWYGSNVLMNLPTINIKNFSTENEEIIRFAIPSLNAEKNIVEIEYKLVVINKETKKTARYSEKHQIRYFFMPELEYLLKKGGFELLFAEETYSCQPIGSNRDVYSICVCAKKI